MPNSITVPAPMVAGAGAGAGSPMLPMLAPMLPMLPAAAAAAAITAARPPSSEKLAGEEEAGVRPGEGQAALSMPGAMGVPLRRAGRQGAGQGRVR